ncbi:MAG: hypothetical protein ACK4VO_03290 [Pseudobdellovibrio sp.]
MKLVFTVFIFLSSCSIYKSSDRADFEANPPIQKNTTTFVIQSCSAHSIAHKDIERSFVKNISDEETLWKVFIKESYYFESTSVDGRFCLYKAFEQ